MTVREGSNASWVMCQGTASFVPDNWTFVTLTEKHNTVSIRLYCFLYKRKERGGEGRKEVTVISRCRNISPSDILAGSQYVPRNSQNKITGVNI